MNLFSILIKIYSSEFITQKVRQNIRPKTFGVRKTCSIYKLKRQNGRVSIFNMNEILSRKMEMLRKVFGDRIVAQKSFVSGTKRSNQAENGLKINWI